MIVVTAPTSRIGSQLLGHLVGRAELRVIARDPARLREDVREQTDVVIGSHGDPDVIRAAVDDADTVFWLVPPNPQADDVTAYYRQFTAPFCDAIGQHSVRRAVYVTTLGRGYDREAGHLSAALAMDDMIHSAGIAYRALRMPFFMENLLGQAETIKNAGTFYLPNDVDRTLLTVATRDIARTAARALLDESWTGQHSIPVVGPDNLSPRQMAEIVSDVIGRPVRAEHVPAEEYKTTLTGYKLNPGFVQGLINMAAAQDDGIYDNDAAGASRTATSFEQWCRDTLPS